MQGAPVRLSTVRYTLTDNRRTVSLSQLSRVTYVTLLAFLFLSRLRMRFYRSPYSRVSMRVSRVHARALESLVVIQYDIRGAVMLRFWHMSETTEFAEMTWPEVSNVRISLEV